MWTYSSTLHYVIKGSLWGWENREKKDMALIDVVKWEVNSRELIHKFPSNDLRLGSQLVVYTGQTAYFVKGGKVFDSFEPGTYTIKTENIPLLNKLINLPYGSNSPFQAEVWFVNHLAVLDSKWGTPTPIQLEDPKYEIIVPVRAFGQYGLRVSEDKTLIENLAGNMSSFTVEKIESYFKGMMMSRFNNILSDKMNKEGISILNLNSHLTDISEYAQQALQPDFNKYGIGLENFYIMSINVPEDDPSFIKLKEAKEQLAKLKLMGRDFYQSDRSFGVMERAASNEGAMGGAIGIGMGMNAGVGIGGQMAGLVGKNLNTQAGPPPIPQSTTYYVAVNGQQQGPFDFNTVCSYICQGQITMSTLVWKNGMSGWAAISSQPEFADKFGNTPPPLPPLS